MAQTVASSVEQNKVEFTQAQLDAEVIQDNEFKGNYFQWLKNQFTFLDRFAWLLYGLGLGFQLHIWVGAPITWSSTIAFLGIATGYLCTILMGAKGWQKVQESDGTVMEHLVSGRSANGLLGSVSVIFYCILNAQAGHWFSIVDQLIFFVLIHIEMVIMWRTWGHGESEDTKDATWKQWLIIILGLLIFWAVLTPVGYWLNDSQPIVDSLVLAFGAMASIMYVKRNSSSYILFLLSNVVNIVLWAGALDKGLSPAALAMLAMTIMYMISSFYGFYNMHFVKKGQTRPVVINH